MSVSTDAARKDSGRSRRRDTYERLRMAIVRGDLPAGTTIREVALAEQMGVSRTPLREALFQLEKDGFACADHGKGFRVTELNEQDAAEIYSMMGCLERFALENTGSFPVKKIKRLGQLNRKLSRVKTRSDRIEVDMLFHRELTSGCNNRRTCQLLEDLRAQAARYEWVYGEPETMPLSVREHGKIVEALEQDQVSKAARLLERHSVESIPKLVEYLRQRRQASARM